MRRALRIEYEDCGHGEPVMLIHGAFICDALSLVAREPALADGHRVIWYRRRGYCGSREAPGASGIEGQALDVEALLTHLGVDSAHIVGHSGGGVIAAQLALQAPSRVRSLILNEPAIFPPSLAREFPTRMGPALRAHADGDLPRAVDHFMQVVSPGVDWRSELEAALPGGPKQADENARIVFESELPDFSEWAFDATAADRLAGPVAYLCGGNSGPLIESARDYFLSLVPRAERIDLPGLDHLMNTQRPGIVAAAIAGFLERAR